MKEISPRDVITPICKILNIDPHRIKRMSVTMEIGEPVVVNVERLAYHKTESHTFDESGECVTFNTEAGR